MGIRFQKRRYDVFISYGHADTTRVQPVVALLAKAGLQVWFDVEGGNAASRSSELLSEAIGNSRGAVFLLSQNWKGSTWCKGEFERALAEARVEDEFVVVAARLDDVEAPGWFEIAEIIDLREDSPHVIARLLCSLGGAGSRRIDNRYDVYLSAPWSTRTPLTNLAVEALCGRDLGWRLIGDSPSHKHLGTARIEGIVRTTRGVVAVLPFDPARGDEKTSPYILDEARIAKAVGKPLLLLAEPGVVVPQDILACAFRSVTLASGADAKSELQAVLNAFDENIERLPHDDTEAYIFYAGSLMDRVKELRLVIERGSNMPFVMGEGLSGISAPQAIIDLIRRAALVLAEITGDRRNTMMEVGVAMAFAKQLRLVVQNASPGVAPKKPFMLEGQEVFGYDTIEELLCLCYRFAREYRRRVYSG